jgi:hypothetical protein
MVQVTAGLRVVAKFKYLSIDKQCLKHPSPKRPN